MRIVRVSGDLYDANVFIIEKDEKCIIIDAGANLEKIKNLTKGKRVLAVFLTHGHYDHSAFCNDYADAFRCKIFANENIFKTIQDPDAICSEDGQTINGFSNFVLIKGDGKIGIDDFDIEYHYCPGHSICSEVYIIEDILFSGDVLFDKSFGRTDLKYGSKKDMINSLSKIEKLDFKYVMSGHGFESKKEDQLKNIEIFKRFLSR
jgi:glyoxylase-like metal-dependent hydrolase (beta-lactamase superfamily II)